MINFIKYRKTYFAFSAILILASIVALVVFGLNYGIDFTGGSIMEIEYKNERPSNQEILDKLVGLDLGNIYIQTTGEKGVIIKMKNISEDIHQEVVLSLSQDVVFVPEEGGEDGDMQMQISMVEIEEKRFESIGPVIGQEIRQKTILVAIVALLSMILYIAFSFRKVQRPLKSWQYGIISVIALFHDLLIPLGVFSLLGRHYGIEFTIPVVTALLAVLGYSINNTVVVFDRIREHLLKTGDDFNMNVNASLNQTLSRQINTSLTTLFVAGAVYFFGGATLQYFALALILGILAGTYSSIFLAGPLLFSWNNIKEKRRF